MVSVNSFGIIHIKTSPSDTEIWLNSDKKYNSSEKYFTDYGVYSADFGKN